MRTFVQCKLNVRCCHRTIWRPAFLNRKYEHFDTRILDDADVLTRFTVVEFYTAISRSRILVSTHTICVIMVSATLKLSLGSFIHYRATWCLVLLSHSLPFICIIGTSPLSPMNMSNNVSKTNGNVEGVFGTNTQLTFTIGYDRMESYCFEMWTSFIDGQQSCTWRGKRAG